MGWFSLLFAVAFVIALVTGEAYFRGPIRRNENPRDYWGAVIGYALLALLEPVVRLLKK
jgi:hypothetical protein